MPANINTPLQLNGPFVVENRYLNNGVPWASVTEVVQSDAVQEAYRVKGLTVLVGKREYWFRDGTADADLIPKGHYDVVPLVNVDGSYQMQDEELILVIVAIPNTAAVTNFKIGSTAGAGDFVGDPTGGSVGLTQNQGNVFPITLYSNGATTIYFSGVAGTNTTVIVKIFKH